MFRRPAVTQFNLTATPVVEAKLTKFEFASFFMRDVKSHTKERIKARLARLPNPSPEEVEAIGHYLAASNLSIGFNETIFLQHQGNNFKEMKAAILSRLTQFCETDEEYEGAKDEIDEWVKLAAHSDPYTLFMWHHDRLKAGVLPSYFPTKISA
jgi:hypothetical protein